MVDNEEGITHSVEYLIMTGYSTVKPTSPFLIKRKGGAHDED